MTAHSKAAVAAGDKLAELCDRKISTSDDYVNAMDVVAAYLATMAEEGWKLTPREPSESMRAVYDDVCYRSPGGSWRIMHDAAPRPEDVV